MILWGSSWSGQKIFSLSTVGTLRTVGKGLIENLSQIVCSSSRSRVFLESWWSLARCRTSSRHQTVDCTYLFQRSAKRKHFINDLLHCHYQKDTVSIYSVFSSKMSCWSCTLITNSNILHKINTSLSQSCIRYHQRGWQPLPLWAAYFPLVSCVVTQADIWISVTNIWVPFKFWETIFLLDRVDVVLWAFSSCTSWSLQFWFRNCLCFLHVLQFNKCSLNFVVVFHPS